MKASEANQEIQALRMVLADDQAQLITLVKSHHAQIGTLIRKWDAELKAIREVETTDDNLQKENAILKSKILELEAKVKALEEK